jgi:hypothetical protein
MQQQQQQQQKWGNIYLKSFSPGKHTPTHVDVVSILLLTPGFLSEGQHILLLGF